MSSLGQGADWDPEEFDSVVDMIAAFKFGIFVTVLESKYAKDLDEGGMREAIRDIHDYFVKDAVKKGHLGKKMDLLPAYREHYFVLQPQVHNYNLSITNYPDLNLWMHVKNGRFQCNQKLPRKTHDGCQCSYWRAKGIL